MTAAPSVVPNLAKRFTMSGLARAIECPAHLVLPHSKTTSQFASHGVIIHDFLERVRTMGEEKALAFVPLEHQAACRVLDLDNPALALDPGAYAAEVAFAYDVATGNARELGRGLGRDYSSAKKGEICGTADVVGLSEDAVIIIDYKTGWADLGPLWKNWQLRAYALAACRTYGKSRAIIIIVRIKSDGDAYATPSVELSELDLALTAAEIEVLRDRSVELELLLREKGRDALPTSQGPWCTYCPAYDRCPAKQGLIRAALDGKLAPPEDDFDDAAWAMAWLELERLDDVTKRFRERCETRARAQPIPVTADEVVSPVERKSRRIDAKKGLEVLLDYFGSGVESFLKTTVTLDDLTKKAAPPVIKGRKDPETGRKLSATKYVAEVFEHLMSSGAGFISKSYPVTRHKVKANELQLPDVTELEDNPRESE